MTNDISVEVGRLVSAWQQPENRWAEIPGSIHNDEVATKIGMRGGTIPGTVHLNHFVPIIQATWGRRWYERGAISMFYTFATTHREDVRAVMATPASENSAVVKAHVENMEEKVVCRGSLSVGDPAETNYVSGLPLEDAPTSELRILADMKVGMSCPENEEVVADDGGGQGEYDGMVVYPASMYRLLNAGFPPKVIKRAVGFFGAIEIRLVSGPIETNKAYRRTGKVVCVGASPKTEFAWVDSQLQDPSSGRVIAEMRHLTRWMKASSELWGSKAP